MPWRILAGLFATIILTCPASSKERKQAQSPCAQASPGSDRIARLQVLLEADVDAFLRWRTAGMGDVIRTAMGRAGIGIRELSAIGGELRFLVRDPRRIGAALALARTAGARDWNAGTAGGGRIVMRQTGPGQAAATDEALEVARAVIGRRLAASGACEPVIVRQGRSRIRVEVGGVRDPDAVQALISRASRFELRLVAETVGPAQLASGRAPPGTQILPYAEGPDGGRIAVLRRAAITGARIADARQDFDESGEPSVTIRFDDAGGRHFARITQQNVNRRFAIVLDDRVISAPVIREPILGGTASISGSFTVQTANQLAIALRSGRLPVELRVVEVRSLARN